MSRRILSLIALLALFAGGVIWAQDSRGTIMGRITDPSGAVIPAATVVVTNDAMGTKVQQQTGPDGYYHAPFLTPGQYKIEVSAPGFKKIVREGIEVRVADRLEINLALELGASEQSVTVTAEAPHDEYRVGLHGHGSGFPPRGQPAGVLRQSLSADRTLRGCYL